MKTMHTGMKISDAEFGVKAENVVKTMTTFSVLAQEQGEALAMPGGMKGDIVIR